MKPLFSRAGLKAFAAHLSKPAFFVFDYDGVLAPLIDSRDAAKPRPSTLNRMNELIKQAPVGVVTGRALGNVKRVMGFRPRYVVGNHGIEGLAEFKKKFTRTKKIVQTWQRELRTHEAIFKNGGQIEDKKLSLTLHYRTAHHPDAARKAILRAIATLKPKPRVVPGQHVFNLVVAGTPHKGDAVKRLMKRVGRSRVVYIADDVTDEDVFRIRDPRLFCVRVGKKQGSAAKYYVPDQRAVDTFLDMLITASIIA